jgi:molybdopterin-containing oxidoreductase family iron-sulfur binding subunit
MGSRARMESQEPTDPQITRRQILRGAAAAPGALALSAPTIAKASAPSMAPLPPATASEGVLLRMQREVRRSIEKPLEQRRWVMAIDTRRCVGCSACAVSCAADNKLPPEIFYRRVTEETTGTYPEVRRRFFSQGCMQCDEPPCIPVCPVEPTKATYQRPDGVVAIDYERCIGCGACVGACPYDARALDTGQFFTDGTPRRQPYESVTAWEYGRAWKRDGKAGPAGKARKCHFCLHRVEVGMLPACVTTCISNTIAFGDLNDPSSLVSELSRRSNVTRLKEDAGTKPRVFCLT